MSICHWVMASVFACLVMAALVSTSILVVPHVAWWLAGSATVPVAALIVWGTLKLARWDNGPCKDSEKSK
jgi:hypothetical protein